MNHRSSPSNDGGILAIRPSHHRCAFRHGPIQHQTRSELSVSERVAGFHRLLTWELNAFGDAGTLLRISPLDTSGLANTSNRAISIRVTVRNVALVNLDDRSVDFRPCSRPGPHCTHLSLNFDRWHRPVNPTIRLRQWPDKRRIFRHLRFRYDHAGSEIGKVISREMRSDGGKLRCQ